MDALAAGVNPVLGRWNVSVQDLLYPVQNFHLTHFWINFVLYFLIVVTEAVESKTEDGGG